MIRPSNGAFNGFGFAGNSGSEENVVEMESPSSSKAESTTIHNAERQSHKALSKSETAYSAPTSKTGSEDEQKKKKKALAWKQWQTKQKSNQFLPGLTH